MGLSAIVNPNPSDPFTIVTVSSSAAVPPVIPAVPEEDTLSSWGVIAEAEPGVVGGRDEPSRCVSPG